MAYLQSTAQELDIYHFYVGNGDATLMVVYFPSRDPMNPGANVKKTVLIDGGYYRRDANQIENYVTNTLKISKINYVVASHYDADHVGGLSYIFQDCLEGTCQWTIDSIYDRGEILYNKPDKGKRYKTWVQNFCTARPTSKRITATPGLHLTLWQDADPRFNIEMQCWCVNALVLSSKNGNSINVNKKSDPDENDLCTGFLINYGKFSYLTSGDIGGFSKGNYQDIETSLITAVGKVSAYKVNHHGSENSTNEDWVTGASAGVAIISTGPRGNFEHPNAEVAGSLSEAFGKRNREADGRLNIIYDEKNGNQLQNYYLTYSINKFNRAFGAGTNGILNTDITQPIILKVTRTFAFPPGGPTQSDIADNCAYTVMNNWYFLQNSKWNRQLNPSPTTNKKKL